MNGKSTKLRIVDCAMRLFRDKGYPNVTVEDICQEAGVTRSAFYYHFNERDEVFDELLIIPNARVSEHLPELLESGSYLDQFYAIYDIYFECLLAYGLEVLGLLCTRSITKHMDFLAPDHIGAWDTYVDLIEKAQRAGQISNTAPAAKLVETAVYLGGGLAAIWCSCNGSFDLIAKTHESFDVLFLGIST